ncbi:unnamed protein product (macronuclear) [Paramecium tetraurelia]|uniref:Uncharacterized protein n=1 Tax=Paramecium tetraurelia TaxID=5888 RepID=A0ECL8_PARTE|nr:uncharacterized protein GSPATT00003904001 [Paramecium tetraurelia]CAK93035.1 unnamed protein product [Paramecium tetraurelia]|eukprot:XP_001460432.1 hypothetical protein (macronuclear) [Paramecium tetraurelia strain d4-2]
MEQLQRQPAKQLYFTTELFKNKFITEKEKIQLKEFIIAQDDFLTSYFDQYERNDITEQELREKLIKLVRADFFKDTKYKQN